MAKEPDLSAWSSVMTWHHLTNVDAFLNMEILLDCQSAIGMNLMNEEWSCCSLIKLSRIRNFDHDALANCMIEPAAIDILSPKIFVNQNLVSVSDCLQISDQWNIQKHVSLKHQSTW
jgi:hypothetical protein